MQQVTVVPTISSDRDLSGNASGMVTADWSGDGLISGKGAYQVNDRTVVALNTATPLYRDLKTGDTGGDVLALNNELNLLGYNSVPGSDTYGWATSDGGSSCGRQRQYVGRIIVIAGHIVDSRTRSRSCRVERNRRIHGDGRHRNRQNPRIIDETHHQKRHRIRAGTFVDDIRHYGNIASQYH